GVAQNAEAGDLDFHRVAVLEPYLWVSSHADAGGRSGHDGSAGDEGGALAEFTDEAGDGEHHLIRRCLLHDVAIESHRDLKVAWIDVGSGDERGSERAEGVEAFASAVLAPGAMLLPPSGRDVISAAIAEHVVERVLLGNVAG